MLGYPKAILILIALSALLFAGCAGGEPQGAAADSPLQPAGGIGLENVADLQPLTQFGEGLARQATFDPAGRIMAVSSSAGVYLYDTQSWAQQPFAGSGEPARKLAFSPDGRKLAVATSRSARLQLWDVQTGRLERDWPAENSTLLMLAFSADAAHLASVSFSAMRVYAVDSDAPPRLIAAPEGGRFLSAAFSDDLSYAATLLSGPAGDDLLIWRPADGAMVARVEGSPGGWYDAGQFAPSGDELAALQLGPSRRSAQMVRWRPSMTKAERVELALVAGDAAQFVTSGCAAAEEGGPTATGLTDGRVILWSAEGEVRATLSPPGTAAAEWLLLSEDGRRLAAIDGEGGVRVWDVPGGELLASLTLGDHGQPVQAELHPDGRRMAVVVRSGEVVILDLVAGREEATIDRHMLGSVRDLEFSPDGRQLASASVSGVVQLWDPASGAAGQRMPVIAGQVDSVAYAPSGAPGGDLLASGVGERVGQLAFDDSVLVWRMGDATLHWRSTGDKEEIAGCTIFRNRLAYTPDGALLASTSHDFSIQLWRTGDGSAWGRLTGHSAPVMDLAIAPDGALLASASQDGAIRLWSLPTGELVRSLSAESLGMLAVAFSPDGSLIAGGAFTGAVYLWEAASGRLVRQLEGNMTTYGALAFSPDGSLIAAGKGEALQLWSVESGQMVRTLAGDGGDVISVAFSPDGRRVAFGSEAGVIEVWGVR